MIKYICNTEITFKVEGKAVTLTAGQPITHLDPENKEDLKTLNKLIGRRLIRIKEEKPKPKDTPQHEDNADVEGEEE